MGECLCKRFICLKNLNEFFMYLFRLRKRGWGGGCTNACICEHIVSLSYRTDWWMFTKVGRDEVLMVPYKCCCFLARSIQGRIQGRAKIGHEGPLLQQTSSDLKATATNLMHSNDVEAFGMKCYYFLIPSRSPILHVFDVILPYFYAISIDFYAVKCLIYIYFV